MTEQQLIEECVKGNVNAQRLLYEHYAPKMMGLCQRYTNDKDDARDVLHDGFMRLFTKIGSYSGAGSFEGWMKKLFTNTALEHLRKYNPLKNHTELDGTLYLFDENDYNVIDRLSADELMRHVMAMPQGFRTVFNLYVVDGFSHKEIGKMLNIGEASSRSQYARARIWLKERINK